MKRRAMAAIVFCLIAAGAVRAADEAHTNRVRRLGEGAGGHLRGPEDARKGPVSPDGKAMRKLGDPRSSTNRPALAVPPGVSTNTGPEAFSSLEYVLYRVDDFTSNGFVSRQQKIVHIAGWRSASTEFSEERHARVEVEGVRPEVLVKGEYWELDTNKLVFVGVSTNLITEEELNCYLYKGE
jgi:hypothetical protein